MIKINKSQARKYYNEGITIYIIPCKMHPDNIWIPAYGMSKYNLLELDSDITFDKFINEFEYYNCNYETGYYCSYYLK